MTTNSRPIPNWNTTLDILGTQIYDIGEFSFSFKRQTQVYWTVQGMQTPFVIARGPLDLDGSIQWDPATTEQPLDMMLLNAQGPLSVVVSNNGIPNSGTPFTLTFTASQVANIKSKIMRSKALIGYSNSFNAVGEYNGCRRYWRPRPRHDYARELDADILVSDDSGMCWAARHLSEL